MRLQAWCKSDKGLRRESNQDSFLINSDLGIYVVADGMGGHQGGEVASELAVKTFEEFIKTNAARLPSSRDLISQAYLESSRRIFDKANQEAPHLMGMGTTMVGLFVRGQSVFITNVGDSRAYLHRQPNLWQLTEDHSLVYEQVRAGIIKPDQVQTFIGKNVITRSVGYERDVIVDILERPLTSGDRFLLCSDGLSGLITDDKLSRVLNQHRGEKAVDECIALALDHGGDDNVTVLLVELT